ncbi:hypothetical protein Taro_031785, partial [Colocasia esculenta]|nr:hypothetical protein [Colocasia esculenta]
ISEKPIHPPSRLACCRTKRANKWYQSGSLNIQRRSNDLRTKIHGSSKIMLLFLLKNSLGASGSKMLKAKISEKTYSPPL